MSIRCFRTSLLIALCVLLAVAANAGSTVAAPRTRTVLRTGWLFHAGDVAGGEHPDLDDSAWRSVSVPHDFQIEQPWVAPDASERPDNSDPGANVRSRLSPRGFKEMGIGWYRLHLRPDASWQGRRVLIDTEGILYTGDVYVNGQLVGSTDYGYLGFDADITRHLRWDADNVVAVKADTRAANNSRWYTGAGLYRDVSIVVTDAKLHFTRHPLYIVATPALAADGCGADSATVAITAEVAVADRDMRQMRMDIRLLDADGNVVATQTTAQTVRGNQRTREYAAPVITIDKPRLWDVDDPYLYTAVVTVHRADGSVADSVSARFGIRQLDFSPAFGLKLNGRKVLLKGIANHHTLGALGAAAYPRAIEKRLRLLKDYGFNHIRTSHNPYSESLLDLCDELGILVVDELYDKWLTQYTGGRRPWTELWQHDIPEWICRDRNHPSVVLWSLGNELQTYWNIPFADWGVTPYRMQKQLLRRYDDTRLITVAMHPRGRSLETDSLPAPLVMETDIAAYNYRYMYFPGDGRRFPWMMFYQSEATTAAMGPNFYEMDLDRVIGLAYWGAIDYLGESQGWPAKGWAQGVFYIDLTPKPNAYLARSIFRDDEAVVHMCFQEEARDIEWNGVSQRIRRLTDHWTRRDGDRVPLTVYTNADEVEVLVNGRSLGRKVNDKGNPKTRNQVRWEPVEYEAGYIEAIARTDGRIVARHRVATAGPAVALRLRSDLPAQLPATKGGKGKAQAATQASAQGTACWHADGIDLQHITVEAVDKHGRVVPTADAEVAFSLEGDATLVAVSSADHYSDELTCTTHRRLYEGHALAIVRAGQQPGRVTVRATAPGLRAAALTLQTY